MNLNEQFAACQTKGAATRLANRLLMETNLTARELFEARDARHAELTVDCGRSVTQQAADGKAARLDRLARTRDSSGRATPRR